jgi:hypothetical protein
MNARYHTTELVADAPPVGTEYSLRGRHSGHSGKHGGPKGTKSGAIRGDPAAARVECPPYPC